MRSNLNIANPEVYAEAQAKWEAEFPPLAKYGYGSQKYGVDKKLAVVKTWIALESDA